MPTSDASAASSLFGTAEALIGPPKPWECRKHGADGLVFDDGEWEAERLHREAWRRYAERIAKKARAEDRATLPHPLWDPPTRLPKCQVWIRTEPDRPKHGAWERPVQKCRGRSVAWDCTDRRAVGMLYGACRDHLTGALDDDPERVWLWWDGRPVDRRDIEDELTLIVLAGR